MMAAGNKLKDYIQGHIFDARTTVFYGQLGKEYIIEKIYKYTELMFTVYSHLKYHVNSNFLHLFLNNKCSTILLYIGKKCQSYFENMSS